MSEVYNQKHQLIWKGLQKKYPQSYKGFMELVKLL